ncbi:MAG TPA: sugar ABC transporter permease [Ktedonobacteraceae bacterium]
MTSGSLIAKEQAPIQPRKDPPKRGLSRKHREWIAAALFLTPDLIGLFIFLGIPMLMSLLLGFFSADGFGNFTFVGFGNYVQMFSDAQFMNSLRTTLLYIVAFVPGLFITSLLLALLVKQKIPFVGVLRSMFFVPNVISLVVVGFVWKFILIDKIGLLNQILQSAGISGISWLGDPNLALWSVIAITIWFSMGYYMIIFLAGLQEISPEFYEASMLDGANAWQTFWKVTWPLLRPTSFFVLLVSLVSAVAGSQGFDLIYVMTRGGPANATELGIFYIYEQAFQFNNYGYAAAMASFVVAILLVATIIMFAVTKGGSFESD